MKNIVKLDQSVINRIAAGEIIHHPYNAVKELMENSLDAGAKHIHIILMDGGLELIKIKDDGCGIQVEDMPLVCERYATSKLSKYQDLYNLHTFGFRGEALASLSLIAKVTIVSKTTNSSCAYQASYENGKMLSRPKSCAGNQGTIITVQNIFDNTPLRKKVLKSPNEEYHYILDCVQKYAVHNANIGFTLSKSNTVGKDIGLVNQNTNNQIQRIQQIYGSTISSHVKYTEYQDSKWKFTIYASDMMTKGFTNNKTNTFIIFANNRLVENAKMKKAIKQVYSDIKSRYTPPFIYISLQVNPNHIDVNIHPTKNQVHLLDEDKIISKLVNVLDQALSDIPKTAKTKKQKSQRPLPKEATIDHYFKKAAQTNTESSESNRINTPPPSPQVNPLKRGNIKDYFQSLSVQKESRTFMNDIDNEQMDQVIPSDPVEISHHGPEPLASLPSSPTSTYQKGTKKKRESVHLKKVNRVPETQQQNGNDFVEDLDSIRSIQQAIKNTEEKSVSKLLADHTSIGVIDDVLAIIMSHERYYLINYPVISEEYFYQTVIHHFGKFGKLVFTQSISIEACLALTVAEDANASSAVISSHKNLLQAYFKIEIQDESDVCIQSLPMISKNYVPSLDRLPDFLLHLATQIDWENEENCLDAIARELGLLYHCNNSSEWDHVSKSLRQGNLMKAPKTIASQGYLVELDIPEGILNNGLYNLSH